MSPNKHSAIVVVAVVVTVNSITRSSFKNIYSVTGAFVVGMYPCHLFLILTRQSLLLSK
jgi:hypothetical protein